MLAEAAGEDVADGVEVSAAMMRHHALRVARGARGVAERNGVPFVGRSFWLEARIALGYRRLIFDLADPLAPSEHRIVDVDDIRLWSLHQRQRLSDHAA